MKNIFKDKGEVKTRIMFFCLWLLPFFGVAQQIANFKQELETALNRGVTNQMADSLVEKNSRLLVWFYNVDSGIVAHPLKEMINDSLYLGHIDKLFAHKGDRVNVLGCLLASAVNDTSKIETIKEVLIRFKHKNMFVATALFVLDPTALLPVAKCIKAYGFNEVVHYLTLMFLQSERPLLEKFAMDNIFGGDKALEYLAIKALAAIPPKPDNEAVLRQAVLTYDTLMKGWPIAALATYKASNTYQLIKPYIKHSELREVCLRALVASNDKRDGRRLLKGVDNSGLDGDVLNVLLKSGKDEYIKEWLFLFEKGQFPSAYYFLYHQDLNRLKYFETIKSIIKKGENESQISQLM